MYIMAVNYILCLCVFILRFISHYILFMKKKIQNLIYMHDLYWVHSDYLFNPIVDS